MAMAEDLRAAGASRWRRAPPIPQQRQHTPGTVPLQSAGDADTRPSSAPRATGHGDGLRPLLRAFDHGDWCRPDRSSCPTGQFPGPRRRRCADSWTCPTSKCPPRCMSSRVVAPALATEVRAACLRSWKVTWPRPRALLASAQAAPSTPGVTGPPRSPNISQPSGPSPRKA